MFTLVMLALPALTAVPSDRVSSDGQEEGWMPRARDASRLPKPRSDPLDGPVALRWWLPSNSRSLPDAPANERTPSVTIPVPMARCDMACSRRCIVRVAPRLCRGEECCVSVRVHIKKFEFMSSTLFTDPSFA